MSKLALVSILSATTFAAAQDVGVSFTHGVNDYLETPYAPELLPPAGLTFEAWVTYDDSVVTTGVWRYPTVVRQNVLPQSESWFLRVEAGNTGSRTLRWKVVTSSGVSFAAAWPFAAGQLNTWTHVAGTYDGVTTVLYVNGAAVATAAGGTNLPLRDLGGTLRIGKGDDAGTGTEVWSGGIDEVRIWPVARTAAEIQASMQRKLFGVPGRAITWNLDGFLVDTSSGLVLTPTGNPAPFATNPLALVAPVMPVAVGASTAGCLGDLLLLPTGAAQVGNTSFAAACTRVPPGSIAVWGATLGTLPSPIPLLGVGIWVDPTVLVTLTSIASPLGALRLPFPIPAATSPGFQFALQAIVVDPCGPQGFTASNAIDIVLQP